MRVLVVALAAGLALSACTASNTFSDIISGVRAACGVTILTDIAKQLFDKFPSVQAAIDAACGVVITAKSSSAVMATDPTAVRDFGSVTAPDGTAIEIIGSPVKK